MQITEEQYFAHYGTPRRSGRYPWGSGGNEDGSLPRGHSLLQLIKDLISRGWSNKEIVEGLGLSSEKELRAYKSIAVHEARAADIAMVERLKAKGMSNVAIGERMGIAESVVRSYLAPGAKDKADVIQETARILKKEVDKKGLIDVGLGSENFLNVSQERMDTALVVLKDQGYEVHSGFKVRQLGTGKDTITKVLATPGTTWGDVARNLDKVKLIQEHLTDTGKTSMGLVKPLPLSERRLAIRYGDEGGAKEDGVMYIRPGVKDLDLGGSTYAQVRIQVGKNHYLKGMAIYKDDLPDGVDVLFNTNKTKAEAPKKLDALKKIESDPDNPFGAQIRRQITKVGRDGVEKTTSVVNLVREEGDWTNWKDAIASQVLSKQKPQLAREQLDMLHERKVNEFEEIMALTNPVVRKRLLKDLSESADSAAVHLQAAKLPRQGWRTLLPMPSLKENEVYAPGYENGERVALIRYPHGGTFEIPDVVVNNRHRESKKLLGDARDAIAISHKVAERLSGADFDGDTVLVIPNNSGKIKSTPALEGLKNFDPKTMYRGYEGMKVMKDTQTQMGKISNLITDMTIKGASTNELARAVRHSMVVIDAEKHKLNWKQSAIDNNIKDLQARYQQKPDGSGGASTLISRAKGEIRVEKTKPRPAKDGGPIDKKTGELVFVKTGETHYKTGKPLLEKKRNLEVTKNAHDLSSGQPVERVYADHSNRMKELGNRARLAMVNTPTSKSSPSAKKTYANEVSSLSAKLRLAESNKPLERRAQSLANAQMRLIKERNPDMTYEQEKKRGFQVLEESRARIGAKKQQIEITPKEWEAIQAGAITDTKLNNILNNADMEKVRELATPKTRLLMTSAKTARAQRMLAQGYTRSEVAQNLGVSLATLDRTLYE